MHKWGWINVDDNIPIAKCYNVHTHPIVLLKGNWFSLNIGFLMRVFIIIFMSLKNLSNFAVE